MPQASADHHADERERNRAKQMAVRKAEARALKERWEEFRGRTGKSQEAFGAELDLGTQGNVTQYLNGHMALNLEAAEKFARGMGCTIGDFSPRLADMAIAAAQVANGEFVSAMNKSERQLLELFRAMDVTQQDALMGYAMRHSSGTTDTAGTGRRLGVGYAAGISNRKELPAKVAKAARKKTSNRAAKEEFGIEYLRDKVEQIKGGKYGELDEEGVALVHEIEAHLRRGQAGKRGRTAK